MHGVRLSVSHPTPLKIASHSDVASLYSSSSFFGLSSGNANLAEVISPLYLTSPVTPLFPPSAATTTSQATSSEPELSDHIIATINYHCVSLEHGPTSPSVAVGDSASFNAPGDIRHLPIHDIRGSESNYSLQDHGFTLTRHHTNLTDWSSYHEIRAAYFPEVVTLLKDLTGAPTVLPYDIALRGPLSHTTLHPTKPARNPLHSVHIDFSPTQARAFIHSLFPLNTPIPHYIAVNVWRPLPPSSPVTSSPLALCAAKSASNGDFVVKKIVLLNGQVGELWACKYNPSHRWYWIRGQTMDECWVFKLFDSENPIGRVPHCAVKVPEQGDGEGDGRWSVEVRCIVFFEEVDLGALGRVGKERDLAGEKIVTKDEEAPKTEMEGMNVGEGEGAELEEPTEAAKVEAPVEESQNGKCESVVV